jgi:hypothetical protein
VFSNKDAVPDENDEERVFRQRIVITGLGRKLGLAWCHNIHLFNVVLVLSIHLH